MKKYNYEEAKELLENHYQGERLEAALNALEYANDIAIEVAFPNENLIPVWDEAEIMAMGED